MQLSKLGYTPNWVKFKLLDEALFTVQLNELEGEEDQKTEHYRYYTFLNWLESKESLSNKEIDNYLLLAHEDEHELMAGNAVKRLFTSEILTDEQFEELKPKVAEFGDWTKKLIQRIELEKRLNKEPITLELYKECLAYKDAFDDSRLLTRIIKETDNTDILNDFETNGCGKRIRKIAEKKLRKLKQMQ